MTVRSHFALLLVLASSMAFAPSGAAAGGSTVEPALAKLSERAPEQRVVAWVYFNDRAGAERSSLKSATLALSERSMARRARRGGSPDFQVSDLPVHEPYVRALVARGAHVRGVSRWLNAASIEAPARMVPELSRLPFVTRIERVTTARWIAAPEPVGEAPVEKAMESRTGPGRFAVTAPGDSVNYGPTYRQLAMMQVPQLHALGLTGAGVLICMIDSGFKLTHQALLGLNIVAKRDFKQGDTNVGEEAGKDSVGQANHGTMTLGSIGGNVPGVYLGAAYGASFALAKTEWVPTEKPVEMDWWQFAAEWADSLGADVISSSLGYFSFDSPDTDLYAPGDLDGRTTIVARAALEAARRGIVVVNSAGNGGLSGIISPADADSVVAVGAVDSANVIASFSSRGPAADGRIKPDVVAMGRNVFLVSPTSNTSYTRANGTSFSCPLTAGLIALLLEAHPWWRPFEVIEALRGTALNAASPDTVKGWGLVQGLAARNWIPSTIDVPPAPVSLALAAGPNPLLPGDALTVRFAGGPSSTATLDVMDVGGRRVARLFDGAAAGPQTVEWRSDRVLRSGVYWIRLALRESGRESARAIKVVVAR